MGIRAAIGKTFEAGRSSISKTGSWLDHLLTKVTSRRVTDTKDLGGGEGLPLVTVHSVSITVPLPAGPRRQQLVGSQFLPQAWEGAKEAVWEAMDSWQAEEHGLGGGEVF